VALPDRRTIATVEFVADTFSEMLSHVERLCANPAVKFAITPTVDNHWPLSLERRRVWWATAKYSNSRHQSKT
jgi:hypothetical protein